MGIIAISGAHGVGKTTAVYELAAELKKKARGEVGVITEVARECPYPVMAKTRGKASLEAQMWIFTAQIQREMEARRLYPHVISDRCLLDCIAYTIVSGHRVLAKAMEGLARMYVPQAYDVIYFRSLDGRTPPDDGFRALDSRIRGEVEYHLLGLFEKFSINYQTL